MDTDRETSDSASESAAAGSDASHEAKNDASWLHLGKEGAAVVQGFVQLALLEIALTIKTIPKLIGAGFVAVFFLVWAWLSLSVLLGWAAYLLSGWSILAPLTFFTMQMLGAGACFVVIKQGASRLGIPNTRRQWAAFKEAMHGTSADDR